LSHLISLLSQLVQLFDELSILLRSLFDVVLCSSFILDGVHLDSCNGSFHVPQLSIKLLNGLRILLLLLQNLILSRHHIVLVELHETSDITLLVLLLDVLVDVIDHLEDSLFLFLRLCFLVVKVLGQLEDLRLLLREVFLVLVHLFHLFLKHLLEVQNLLLETLDLLLLWFKTSSNSLSSMSKNML